MSRYSLVLLLLVAMAFAGPACTEQKKQEPKTLREKAGAVGRMGDKIYTTNLEKNLVGVVDSASEHAKELEEAAQE